MNDLNAGQSRTIAALREEIGRMRERLEFNPEAPAYDGIACRDETIKLQDERIEKLRAYAELITTAWSDFLHRFADHSKFNGASFIIGEAGLDWARAPMELALAKNPLQGASIREDEDEARHVSPPRNSEDVVGLAAHREISAGTTTQPPDHSEFETGKKPHPDRLWWSSAAQSVIELPGHEAGRDPIAHQTARIEHFRHDAVPGAAEIALSLAPVLAPQGWSAYLSLDGIYEWENDHWRISIEPIDEPTPMMKDAKKLHDKLRHQSGKKSDGAMYVTVPVMPTDAMLEALYGPYLSPTSHATRRAAWAEALAAVPPPSGIVIPPIGAHPELAMAVNQPPRSEFQVGKLDYEAMSDAFDAWEQERPAGSGPIRPFDAFMAGARFCHVAGKKS